MTRACWRDARESAEHEGVPAIEVGLLEARRAIHQALNVLLMHTGARSERRRTVDAAVKQVGGILAQAETARQLP
ncbi:MAG: hypothetical protein ACRDUW_22870 [Pseudonocardiaceae bacterium]